MEYHQFETETIERIQFLSDTHLEHLDRPIPITKVADTIALLGDIGWITEDSYWNFVTECSKKYKHVFLLAGNHEYYFQVLQEVDSIIEGQIKKRDLQNVFYFHNRLLEFANVLIWGGTLWTKPTYKAFITMNDGLCIADSAQTIQNQPRNMSISRVHRMHNNAINSILKAIDYAKSVNKPIVIMSHHAPLLGMNGPFQGTPRESGYASDLSNLFQAPVCAWICGHTHQNLTICINDIPCRANCYGYPNETLPVPYDPKAFISIK